MIPASGPTDAPLALEPQLDRIVSGELAPKNAKQAIDFAWVCHHRGKHRAATRLFGEAVARGATMRFDDPANSAVLGGDLRQGLAWLREYLKWNRTNKRPDRLRKLEVLKIDPEFASVRDGQDVPEDWRAFWAEVDRLIARERAGKPAK